MKYVDDLIKLIKFPADHPRTQRSMSYYNIFKANEFLSLIMYSLIFALKPVIPVDAFHHLMKYILFLRILTQDELTKEDIDFARVLIHEFSKDFTRFYAEKGQTFNLHAHLHLCDQVERFGPLHKHDCFPFEGWFKNAETLHNGTSNLSGQVANNLNIKIKAHYENRDIIIDKKELREFVQKYSHNDWYNKTQLETPIIKGLVSSFKSNERTLIKEFFQLSNFNAISYSFKSTLNNISMLLFILKLKYLKFYKFFFTKNTLRGSRTICLRLRTTP